MATGYHLKETDMDAVVVLLVIVVALVALDLAALRWGVDSRPHLTDDHGR